MLFIPNAWVILLMPAILRIDGFVVRIFLPPREHEPPHVHVLKGGTEAVILIDEQRCDLREVHGMSDADILKAFRIVEANAGLLLREWGRLHGK